MIGRLIMAMAMVGLSGCAVMRSGDWPLEAQVNRFDGTAAPARSTQNVVIATYNVHELIDRQGVQKDLAEGNADVWLLQEVRWRRDDPGGEKLRELLPPGAWEIAAVGVSPFVGESGDVEAQVIASRFPIIRAEVWPCTSRSRRRRCILAAWIRIEGREVLVLNIEHEPGFFATSPPQDGMLNELIERLKTTPDQHVIVGGDFNTCGDLWRLRSSRGDASAARTRMKEIDFTPALDQARDTFYSWPVRLSLDNVYGRNVSMLEAGVTDSARGSDHRPVWCRIGLDRP